MAKVITVTILATGGPQQQAVNIDAVTRYIPVQADSIHPERLGIFLMWPAASEDRFECVHTFRELHDMIEKGSTLDRLPRTLPLFVFPDQIQLVCENGDLTMRFLMEQALGFLFDDPVIGQAVEFFHVYKTRGKAHTAAPIQRSV